MSEVYLRAKRLFDTTKYPRWQAQAYDKAVLVVWALQVGLSSPRPQIVKTGLKIGKKWPKNGGSGASQAYGQKSDCRSPEQFPNPTKIPARNGH
eukprot:77144-Amphidinium_carterae.1